MMKQLPLPLPHDAAMGVDDFLVTACNREAAAWIDAWPEWPAPGVVVTGAAGCGKTHVMNLWLDRARGRAIALDELVGADAVSLIAGGALIAIDDVDKAAKNARAEENLFHLFNHIKEAKGGLVLTMRRPVAQTGFVLPDLRSRLLTLPVAALGEPDDTLLEALIVKQFRDRQIALDVGVVAYLVPRIQRDAASVRDIVERLDVASLAQGRKITNALAREILESSFDR